MGVTFGSVPECGNNCFWKCGIEIVLELVLSLAGEHV